MSALMDTTPNPFVGKLRRSILLTSDLDYHIIRGSMVIIFVLFGYQKWWAYEAERLVPFISNGPLISWLYIVFSHQGASWLLACSNGPSARYCLQAFGTSGSASSAPSVRLRRSSERSRSFPSCRTAGIP